MCEQTYPDATLVNEVAKVMLDRGLTRQAHLGQGVVQRVNDQRGWTFDNGATARLTPTELDAAHGAAHFYGLAFDWKHGPFGVKEEVARQVICGELGLAEVDVRIGWDVDGLYLPLKAAEKEWVKALVADSRAADSTPTFEAVGTVLATGAS